jgi:hypothetical protein
MVTFLQNLFYYWMQDFWDLFMHFIHLLDLWKHMLSVHCFVIFFKLFLCLIIFHIVLVLVFLGLSRKYGQIIIAHLTGRILPEQ